MATNDDTYALDIEWSSENLPNLPTLVGPFASRNEAEQWAKLNAGRSTCNIRTLSWPYLRSNPAT
ncbi:MAG: hypothetical protein PHQ28_00365 [Mycobacterium sp.]|nr:hypothetical protein [Mycobacterium sp.]